MSEPVKYGYRAIGGTFVVILLSIICIIALVFLGSGLALMGLSWLPFAFPELLEMIRITFLGSRIIDPFNAFVLFFISGLTLTAVGIIIFGIAYYIAKSAQIIDKDLSESVAKIPSIKVLKSRKGKAVFILGIMLFGTFLTFIAIIF